MLILQANTVIVNGLCACVFVCVRGVGGGACVRVCMGCHCWWGFLNNHNGVT